MNIYIELYILCSVFVFINWGFWIIYSGNLKNKYAYGLIFMSIFPFIPITWLAYDVIKHDVLRIKRDG